MNRNSYNRTDPLVTGDNASLCSFDHMLVLGGVRSGKSGYAQTVAQAHGDHPMYLATAVPSDDDFRARVARHQADRGSHWQNLERASDPGAGTLPPDEVVVVDCVTMWLFNLAEQQKQDWDAAESRFAEELTRLLAHKGKLILVSNEVGLGVHPPTQEGRRFADLQGRANQRVARLVDTVILMVAGIPVSVKSSQE